MKAVRRSMLSLYRERFAVQVAMIILKAAKQIGLLTIPPNVLARADRVIR